MGLPTTPKPVFIPPAPPASAPTLGAKVRTGLLWDQEEIDLLRALAGSRTCLKSICSRLRRSEGSVRKKANELGVEVSRFSFRGPIILPQRAEDITSLYRLVVDKGWSKSARAREIIRICADKNGLTIDTILSPQRTQKVAEARQQAMWMVARETSMSLAEIGRIFDRDHTTVIYAIQRENERTGESVRSDQKLVRKMARAGL
jgi:hypothetical protein